MDFAMQPLSKVNPKASVTWGALDIMTGRPKVATKIAECIAEWADVETMLGLVLAFLLDTDSKAALAIYASIESSSAQRRMILAAAKTKVDAERFDALTVMMSAVISPVMKERNKFAHWCWAFSPEIPDCLLLCKPDQKMILHLQAVNLRRIAPEIPFDMSLVYVVTEQDAARLADRLRMAKHHVALFLGAIWTVNSAQQRDGFLRELSIEPQIREGMERLSESRKKGQASQQPSAVPDLNGEA
jgi:hypothetical protein